MSRFRTGDTVGNHQIINAFPPGGFGEAYSARNILLERIEVLKCVRSDLKDDPKITPQLLTHIENRFWTEAKAQARLSHEFICMIFDLHERERMIAMELIEGQTLEEIAERGRVQGGELIDIGVMIADALAYAHENDVLHRDLSPRNIMLTPNKRIKVLDFGLAKLTDQEPASESESYGAGTEPYMSPEQQISLAGATHRSDIFSLGAVLYRLYTGRNPFSRRFQEGWPQTPPTFDQISGVEPWDQLEEVLTKALHVAASDRQASMAEFRQQLVDIREELTYTERNLSFFSASTLFEVVRPSNPAGDTAAKELAQNQLVTNQEDNFAITSPSVLGTVVERISELHFEGTDPGLSSKAVQGVLRRARRHIARSRPGGGKKRPVRWGNLTACEKRVFLNRAGKLFLPGVEAISKSFSRAPADNAIFASKYLDVSHRYPETSDYHLLAEAQSMDARFLFAGEPHYRKGRYSRILKAVGPNHYEFIGPVRGRARGSSPGTSARPGISRQSREKPGSGQNSPMPLGDGSPTVTM